MYNYEKEAEKGELSTIISIVTHGTIAQYLFWIGLATMLIPNRNLLYCIISSTCIATALLLLSYFLLEDGLLGIIVYTAFATILNAILMNHLLPMEEWTLETLWQSWILACPTLSGLIIGISFTIIVLIKNRI